MTARHPRNARASGTSTRVASTARRRTRCARPMVRAARPIGLRQAADDSGRAPDAWRARLCCPTASVRTSHHLDVPTGCPGRVDAGRLPGSVYNARASWGAHSFAIRRPAGNVHGRRAGWTPPLHRRPRRVGGLSDILLTHRYDSPKRGGTRITSRARGHPRGGSRRRALRERHRARARTRPARRRPARDPRSGTRRGASPTSTTGAASSPRFAGPGTSRTTTWRVRGCGVVVVARTSSDRSSGARPWLRVGARRDEESVSSRRRDARGGSRPSRSAGLVATS